MSLRDFVAALCPANRYANLRAFSSVNGSKETRCAASTTFAGQRQLFLPAKGQQRECP
jgi:hypothetical protein